MVCLSRREEIPLRLSKRNSSKMGGDARGYQRADFALTSNKASCDKPLNLGGCLLGEHNVF